MEKQAGVLLNWTETSTESDERTRVLRTAFAELGEGRIDALETIWDSLGREMYGLALYRTGSRPDAEDAVQEVFTRLARCRPIASRVRQPRAYLLSMIHHAAIDASRRHPRNLSPEPDYVIAQSPDIDRQLEAQRASALINRLSPKQREAVFLRVFSELSFREIARVTAVSTFTAASRYRLGISRLRKRMGL